MSDFSYLVVWSGVSLHDRTADMPSEPGLYYLFDDAGKFIYVGQTADLNRRLGEHSGPRERNWLTRAYARYYIYRTTRDVEQAQELEGAVYDAWYLATGRPPLANQNRPPRATVEQRPRFLEQFAKAAASGAI